MLHINLNINVNNKPISQKISISTKDLFRQMKPQIEYKDGSYYKGELSNQKRHGNGTLYDHENRVIFQGVWNNNCYEEGVLFNNQVIDAPSPFDYTNLSNLG